MSRPKIQEISETATEEVPNAVALMVEEIPFITEHNEFLWGNKLIDYDFEIGEVNPHWHVKGLWYFIHGEDIDNLYPFFYDSEEKAKNARAELLRIQAIVRQIIENREVKHGSGN